MYLLTAAICLVFLLGCKGTGFRELPDASEQASAKSALEAMQTVEAALEQYRLRNGDYPRLAETNLFDTLSKYFLTPVDQAHIYRNERTGANYIAIGSRRNKLVYRYPATIGSGDYTLYWVGANGVDEEGSGDDRFPVRERGPKQFYRRILRKQSKNGIELEYILRVTGIDPKKDSMVFSITNGEKQLYADSWSVANYVARRLDLTEREKQDVISQEVSRFFSVGHFIPADSLLKHESALAKLRASGKWSPSRQKDVREVFVYSPSSTSSIIAFYDPAKSTITIVN